jgi:hypothetical protein
LVVVVNVMFVVFAAISTILDKDKCGQGKKQDQRPKELDKSEVQLAELDESDTSRMPETIRKLQVESINIEIGDNNSPVKFRSDIKSKDKREPETEKKAESPLSFKKRYCNAFKFYHRFIGMFYSIDGSVYRVVNVVGSFA